MRCVYLTDDQARLLRRWGRGDASAGLRWLIDSAATRLVKTDDGKIVYAAGRTTRRGIFLSDAHTRLLRTWGGGNVSAGLRWLIDAAALLLKKVMVVLPPSS